MAKQGSTAKTTAADAGEDSKQVVADTKTTNDRAQRILSHLERAQQTGGHRMHRIFDDWLHAVECALIAMPRMAAAVASESTEWDDPDPQLWSNLRETYGDAGASALAAAFGELLLSVDDGYQDVVGAVYMLANLGGEHGQFFTPMGVARLMATTTTGGVEEEVKTRLLAAIEKSPPAAAALIAGGFVLDEGHFEWLIERVLPFVDVEPVSISDPACGSGVMFLAAASTIPLWMIRAGLVQFVGTDIDATCVAMARLNLLLYGLGRVSAPA